MVVCVSVIRHILPMSIIISCLMMSGFLAALNSSTDGNENVLLSFYMYGAVVQSVLSGLGCK
jgi:hypothetical protein